MPSRKQTQRKGGAKWLNSENYECNPASCQCKLIAAGSVPVGGGHQGVPQEMAGHKELSSSSLQKMLVTKGALCLHLQGDYHR